MAVFRSFSTITPADHGKEASLAGWVEDVRNLGGIAFLIVRQRDGTFQATIKKKSDPDLFNRASKVVRESVVAVRGRIEPNPQVRNGWELTATALDVLSPAAAPLPLPIADKVGADMDTRFDNRPLDLRKPERRAIFRVRAVVAAAFRSYLDRQGFVEVQTPKLAGADGEVSWIERQEDFFPLLEGAVDAAIERVRAECKADLALLRLEPKRPALPLKRLPYPEALEILRGRGKRLRDGDDIDTEGEKILGQEMGQDGRELYFITEYPTAIKPFYVMAKTDEPEYSFSFDLEYKGDEMASGGQREHRYDVLLARMKEKALNPENFEFYLKAFRYGMPPHGGWGFGLDRFVQKLLDLPNIREAILFPRDRVRLVP